MNENCHGVNYQIAKAEADKVDEQIIEILQTGSSFLVEAGAGSGKTYSLNKVIEWIQSNKWTEYNRKKQNVVCITYTNAAVDVISERLSKDSFILPSTIHSFAWNAIKQYQGFLISTVATDPDFTPGEGDFFKVNEVAYTLGHRYKENGVQYLYHDDVLKLFCMLLDNAKFRYVFASKYPLILIDEYQDSYAPIIERFINFFIAENKGPQFGFFGDAWQTIYQSNKACGAIEHNNLMNTVEPVYKALETSNMQLLFDALEIKRYPITKKSEKARWKNFHKQLKEVRRKKAIDVFELVNQSNLIPVPPKLEGYYRLYCDAPETIYAADTTIQSFLNLDYAQFVTAIDFMYPDAMFSTEHGVKGEEYDNVVFVIGRGWNQYQFEVYAPMITGQSAIPTGKQASYERNRNLFYVCCSRPKKRLFLFISIPIEPTFRSFLVELVGEQNIFTYSQYLESNMK